MGFALPATAGAVVLYLLGLAIYRLTLHPLAKYPGPRLAAISNWHVFFYTWRGDMHVKHQAWHAKYGGIVRAGPNTLWFNDPSMMNKIYSVGANVRKADAWMALSPSRNSGNLLSSIDKTIHGFKRRTIGPLFSDQGLKQLEHRIIDKIQRFISLLPTSNDDDIRAAADPAGWGPAQDMAHLCDWLSFDIVSDITYGEGLNMLQSPEMRWIAKVYAKLSHWSMMALMQPKVYEWKWILLVTMYKDIINIGTWTYNRAKARASREKDDANPDVFDALMSANDHKRGREYKMKDLWIESMLLLPAGSDTTSTTISAVFFFLLHKPEALAHATAEVREAFTSADDINHAAQANSCRFLQACINETMRLVPAGPLVSPRSVQAGGLTVAGHYIPAGTTVGTALYTMHPNPEYFSNPNSFCPERWLVNPANGVTEKSVNRALQAFAPFSAGPRRCVGWKLAWMELNVVLARTLFLYDMRMAPEAPCCANTNITAAGGECQYSKKAGLVMAREGPVVQFRRAN